MSLVAVTTPIIWSSRSSSGRCLEIVAAHGILFTCVLCFSSFLSLVHICDDDLYCFSCDVWYFVQGNTACFAGSWLSEMEMCAILKSLNTQYHRH